MTSSFAESGFHRQIRSGAGQMIWLGAALLVLGVAALAFPIVSTLAATLFVGWILVMSGVVALFGAFSIRGAGPFFGALLVGLLSLAAGLFMLFRPVAGELAITLTLGGLFMIQGAFEIFFAVELRPVRGWGWMLFSALASILLAALIIAGWPGSSLVTLGILIGVNFITSGLGYIFVGGAAKRGVAV